MRDFLIMIAPFLVWFLAVTELGLEVFSVMTRTEPVLFAGVLRYAQSGLTPAFAKTVNTILSFGGVIPLIAVGLAHLIRHKSPFLMLAGISMFIFSALAPATGNMDLNFLLTMVGEDIMVFFFGFELARAGREAAGTDAVRV